MSEQPVSFPTVAADEPIEGIQLRSWYATALVWIGLVVLLVPLSILLTHPTVFGIIGEAGVLVGDPEWGAPFSLAAAGVALIVGWWVAKQSGAATSRTDLALSLLLLPVIGLVAWAIYLFPISFDGYPVPALVGYLLVAILAVFGGARLLGRQTPKQFLIPAIAGLCASLLLLPPTLPTETGYTAWMPNLSFIPVLVGLVAPRGFGLEADPSGEDPSPMRFFAGCFLITMGTTIVMSFAGHAGLALVG